ncbi:MAG: hypothetical protein Q9M26_03045 [Mariprofundales bacterium]|nr:hypothetical protein [Mariprofundales bacterium]
MTASQETGQTIAPLAYLVGGAMPMLMPRGEGAVGEAVPIYPFPSRILLSGRFQHQRTKIVGEHFIC